MKKEKLVDCEVKLLTQWLFLVIEISHNRKISWYVLMNCILMLFNLVCFIKIKNDSSSDWLTWAFEIPNKNTSGISGELLCVGILRIDYVLIHFFSWSKNLEISRDISKNPEMRYVTFYSSRDFSFESTDCFRIWPRPFEFTKSSQNDKGILMPSQLNWSSKYICKVLKKKEIQSCAY